MKVFDLVPCAQFDFANVDALSRLCFGLIYDRFRLSYKHREQYTDATGIYCVYERRELMDALGVTQPTIRRCMAALEGANLIVAKRVGVGAAYRYYMPRRVWAYMRGDYDGCELALLEPFSADDLTPLRE